ncbi:succinate dehydrogenase assembly factor 2 [Alkalisalibacterium limincola]|uniref:FAD assembly factor SdhE n=2 Tax=Alkalisalibacterium limincola TaxID=2699169 RepID=A0A5C8L057_9GAMM|nr:succinate dehydrogenase assembly factor 2 [Alkalisalibacterium limincola]
MGMPADDEAELRRLRWRCRRGMRELDQLMLRYLDQRWRQAGVEERATFERLLEVEDDRLWRWFMGRETPQEKDLHALVERILELPH